MPPTSLPDPLAASPPAVAAPQEAEEGDDGSNGGGPPAGAPAAAGFGKLVTSPTMAKPLKTNPLLAARRVTKVSGKCIDCPGIDRNPVCVCQLLLAPPDQLVPSVVQ